MTTIGQVGEQMTSEQDTGPAGPEGTMPPRAIPANRVFVASANGPWRDLGCIEDPMGMCLLDEADPAPARHYAEIDWYTVAIAAVDQSIRDVGRTTMEVDVRAAVYQEPRRTFAGTCPCGDDPSAEHYPYCSYDCVPSTSGPDTYSTPMRWRPDMISGVDDTGLEIREPRRQLGEFWVQIFERAQTDRLHLRMDDGHRFVGLDVDLGDPETLPERCEQTWEKLRRQLTSRRFTEPDPSPGPELDSYPCGCQQHALEVPDLIGRPTLSLEAQLRAYGRWHAAPTAACGASGGRPYIVDVTYP